MGDLKYSRKLLQAAFQPGAEGRLVCFGLLRTIVVEFIGTNWGATGLFLADERVVSHGL
jgi:hypothetical protein